MYRKILYIILATISSYSTSYSQTYKWRTGIAPVPANGFYNIPLNPELNGRLNNNFTDVRIYDKEGKEVQYLLRKDEPLMPTTSFTDYEVLEKQHKPKCCTEILLHNPQKKPINNINLIIKNADVVKQAKLYGSDDKNTWFVVKDYHEFHCIKNSHNTSEVKILDFPLVNYKYFRLWINDSLSAPINILKAGYYAHFTEKGDYAEIPSPKINQADSVKEKRTYVTISYPSPQYIDKLELQVKGPYFYLRNAKIEIKDTTEKGKTYYRHFSGFTFNSTKPHTLSFSQERIKDLRIIIENEDNPPLEIISSQAWQLKHYLTAYLEKEKNYELQFGNKKIAAAAYDLHFFKDSIPAKIPSATVNEITPVPKFTEPKITAKADSFFTKKLAIWLGIVCVILFLGIITRKMVREMSEQ